MDDAKRSVNCAARDFLAAWWHGDAGPVPCGECSACCYYEGIPVDKKRDRRHLPHLLTERNCDGDLVLQRRADGGCVHLARGAGLYGVPVPTIGLSQLRLPRLLGDGLSRVLRPKSSDPGLAVRRARASPALASRSELSFRPLRKSSGGLAAALPKLRLNARLQPRHTAAPEPRFVLYN